MNDDKSSREQDTSGCSLVTLSILEGQQTIAVPAIFR